MLLLYCLPKSVGAKVNVWHVYLLQQHADCCI